MVRYSLWLTLVCLLVPSVLLSQGLNSHPTGIEVNATTAADISIWAGPARYWRLTLFGIPRLLLLFTSDAFFPTQFLVEIVQQEPHALVVIGIQGQHPGKDFARFRCLP
jgi:hypothetical protein